MKFQYINQPQMNGVTITKLEIVKDDERGSIYQFQNRETPEVLLIKRKKGTASGKHYHTGKNKMKNPETVILLDGKFEMILKNIDTQEEFSKVYDIPIKFEIDPLIYHEIRAISDIILLDMNSIDDDDDTIKGFPKEE